MTYTKKTLTKYGKQILARACYEVNEKIKNKTISNKGGICYNASDCVYYCWINGGYPFNSDSAEYTREKLENRIWKNKKRLAFVRRWAKKHEKTSCNSSQNALQ